MKHPKMQYTYVGIDSHKNTHTAVFMDCFFDKLGEITFDNLPSAFCEFLSKASEYRIDGTEFLFGLEDTNSFGRLLTIFLLDNCQQVKHVNAHLVAKERKNQNITHKTDSVDAECAARILLSKFGELPNADPQNKYWILRTLVLRRNQISKSNTRLKMHLHTLLTQHYPNYRKFFTYIDGKTSIAFFKNYPSPKHLENVSKEDLTKFLREHSNDWFGEEKAELILSSLENTTVEFQETRDDTVRSIIRHFEFNLEELERMEKSMALFLESLDCTLTTMAGLDVVSACQILSCIGDIKRFSTPAKLARYSGIAPITYASGQKDMQFANKRGNRELNSLFFALAVRVTSPIGHHNKLVNKFFYDYFHRKQAEGKTKRQALKCVERRLVNIVWTMLTHNEDFVNPPVFDMPKTLDNADEQ